MADLIAQGPQTNQRWRKELGVGAELTIGRRGADWLVDWDDRISRVHVRLECVDAEHVLVERLEDARNPIFFRGVRRDRFTLAPGEHFVIGRTTFTFVIRPPVVDSAVPESGVTKHVFSAAELRARGFRDAAGHIDVLVRLPELIASSASESELRVRVASVLLQGTPSAVAVSILNVRGVGRGTGEGMWKGAGDEELGTVEVLHYDSRIPLAQIPSPSASLARHAARCGESVLHWWGKRSTTSETVVHQGVYTAHDQVDWAFAVPLPEEAGGRWVLYVTGQLEPQWFGGGDGGTGGVAAEQLEDDVKFAELVAMTLGNLRQMRALEQRQAGLSRFFAPVVMEALAGRDPVEVLQPREAEITALFCDLRGFSRRSEAQADQLMELLRRVSEALGVMTRNILQEDGVIGDFHGDAAMGFWGWPLQQGDAPQRACRTALGILHDFLRHAEEGTSILGNFRCGIGIASGRAVAGRIGTSDQVKVTAFGPVVNLASRLEGMTKQFQAEILIDQATAEAIVARGGADGARVRRLARVRPAGIETPLLVYQLLPPAGTPLAPSDAAIANYEAALDEVLGGDWEKAFRLLHEVPAGDRVKDFLTVYIASHGRVPPPTWDGVIAMQNK